MICHLTRAWSQKNNGEVHSHLRCLLRNYCVRNVGNFPPFGNNNFSTRQRRWEWTSPLFFWDQARVKWHNTCPPSHLKFQSWIRDGGLQDGGRGTHVTHFVQLYPQPLYTASQMRTTSRSWDKGVLTDLCLTLYSQFMMHGQKNMNFKWTSAVSGYTVTG